MKRIILIFILMISSIIYGNTTEERDGRVFIRANYIQDLEIDILGAELDFGDIFPGDKATIEPMKYEPAKVEMRVRGANSQKVQFTYPDSLPLYNADGGTVKYTVDIREKFQDNKTMPSGTILTIPDKNDDTLILYIGGEVDSYTTTKPGNYTGDLYITVRYSD